jgi:hypothetical protein
MNEETSTTTAKHVRKIEVIAEATTLDGWKKQQVWL